MPFLSRSIPVRPFLVFRALVVHFRIVRFRGGLNSGFWILNSALSGPDSSDLQGLPAIRSLGDFELDSLARFQCPDDSETARNKVISAARHAAVVNIDIARAVIRLDESESFLWLKPADCSCHMLGFSELAAVAPDVSYANPHCMSRRSPRGQRPEFLTHRRMLLY